MVFGFIWVHPYSKLRYGSLRVHSLRAPSHSPLKKKEERKEGRKRRRKKEKRKKKKNQI